MRLPFLFVVLLLVVSCTQSLHLRPDFGPDVALSFAPALSDINVAVMDVRDLRPHVRVVGRHRDGLARVEQWKWVAMPTVEHSARGMLELALRLRGAKVVPPDSAQVFLTLEVLEADVTDDGELAGRETFGDVEVHLTAAGASRLDVREAQHFADEQQNDPGLLGAALFEVIARAVQKLPQSVVALNSMRDGGPTRQH